MRRFHAWVAIVIVGAVAGGSWAYAQRSAGSSGRLTGADIADIQQLHSRYNQGWDFRDVDLYLSAYTDDGVFTTGAGEAYKGKTAIKDYLTSSFAKGVSGDVTHNNTSVLVTPTADGASGRVYWYTINVLSQPPAIAGTGHYEDTYVKTADGWRMKSRKSIRGWPRRGPTATAGNSR
jgi:uncharacterized protein (TIGR02246 family)